MHEAALHDKAPPVCEGPIGTGKDKGKKHPKRKSEDESKKDREEIISKIFDKRASDLEEKAIDDFIEKIKGTRPGLREFLEKNRDEIKKDLRKSRDEK